MTHGRPIGRKKSEPGKSSNNFDNGNIFLTAALLEKRLREASEEDERPSGLRVFFTLRRGEKVSGRGKRDGGEAAKIDPPG